MTRPTNNKTSKKAPRSMRPLQLESRYDLDAQQ
jgi:hypothetical protein